MSNAVAKRFRLFASLFVASGILLTQVGCSCNGLNLWPFRTAGCACTTHANQSEPSETYTSTQPSYSYQDGLDVGRQYAKSYAIDRELAPGDPLPEPLRNAGLGKLFEIGLREGINSVYRDQQSYPARIAEAAEAAPAVIQPATPSQPELSLDPPVVAAAQPPVTTQPELEAPPVAVESPVETSRYAELRIEVKKSLHSLFRENFHPVKSMNKSMTPNWIGNKKDGPSQPDNFGYREPQPLNPQDKQQAENLFAHGARNQLDRIRMDAASNDLRTERQAVAPPAEMEQATPVLSARSLEYATPTKAKESYLPAQQMPVEPPAPPKDDDLIAVQNREQQPVRHQEKIIKLTATPLYRIDSQESNRKPSLPVTQTAMSPSSESHGQRPATTTGIESNQSLSLTARTPENTKPQTSVLVDRLDSVNIQLDPIPVLRAQTAYPDNGTAPRSRFINSSHTTERDSGNAEELLDTGSNAKPIHRLIENRSTPAQQTPQRTGPSLDQEGYRLPARGPKLEEMLRSPFDKNETSPNSSQFRSRQANPDNGKVYR